MKTWLKIDRWIDIVQTWICIVLFVLILFFGSIQIFGRYIFGVSTPWSEELMRFSAIWLTIVGSALTIRVDGHVSVDILLGFMKNNKARSVLFTAARLICVVFLIVYLPASIQLVMRSGNSMAASLPISYVYIYSAVPVGIVMMILSYITTIPAYARQYAKGEK